MTIDNETSRRKFLSHSAFFFGWTVLTQQNTRAQDAPRAIGLGFSLYGMKSLPLDAALQSLAEIGYDCIELPVMPDWPADSANLSSEARRELRAKISERGLRLTALMENLPTHGDDAQHRSNLQRLKLATQLAHDLATDKKPLIETILGGRPGDFESVKQRLVERLKDWAEVLKDAQIALAIKAHIGNATQRPEQLSWLLDQVTSPWLVAAYDYSHFQLQDLDLKQTTDALLPRARFIHVKDTEHALGKRTFLLPGEGSIDYVQMFKLLSQSTYQGDVVVEVSSQVFNRAGYDPLAAARKCYDHLADAFARAGLRRR